MHVAKISPFATAGKIADGQLAALDDATASVLTDAVTVVVSRPRRRRREAIGSRVHARTGLRCPVCGDTVREVLSPTSASVLPDLSDRRQGAGRPANVALSRSLADGGDLLDAASRRLVIAATPTAANRRTRLRRAANRRYAARVTGRRSSSPARVPAWAPERPARSGERA